MIYDENLADKYIDELVKEIHSHNIDKLKTIYIGGGTPSSLSISQLENLLQNIVPYIDDNYEFTIECNFENINKEKLLLFKKYHVNRLSFGVQSLNNDILKQLNRHHSREEVFSIINLAKEIGFNNINIDLIYGLPDVDEEMLRKDLEDFIKLDISHISTYSLTISPNTLFYINNVKEINDGESRRLYDVIYSFLNENGFNRYEVSNFAKLGFESKHNTVYWDNKNYIGVGVGASGYLGNIRYQNTKSINRYLKGDYLSEQEEVTYSDNVNYFLMLKLRKKEGFKIDDLKDITNENDFKFIIEKLEQFIKQNMIQKSTNSYFCTDEGIMLLDIILRDIFL